MPRASICPASSQAPAYRELTGSATVPCMRRLISRHAAMLAVLLCLQVAACMIAMRRDPIDRFSAACVSGLVWRSLRKMGAPGTGTAAPRPTR